MKTLYESGSVLTTDEFIEKIHKNILSLLSRTEKTVYYTLGQKIVTRLMTTYVADKDISKTYHELF